ncbi:MAG: SAM-dependent methyltransferase [Lachnospiraceae bacterium]|nr:SAM-dependent methyltransferase [Lachnospiraceae bacterium]
MMKKDTGRVRDQLSQRLLALYHMVDENTRFCDVGCDHGYLSIALVQDQVCPSALAMDLRPGPLERAKEHIAQAGLEGNITTRLSDGIEKLSAEEADTVLISGMGGGVIHHILTADEEKTKGIPHLILGPQSQLELVRSYLKEAGYELFSENMVEEDGKYYPIMKVSYRGEHAKDSWEVEGGEDMQKAALMFGPMLLSQQHPVLKEYLLYRQRVVSSIRSQLPKDAAGARKEEVERELSLLGMALSMYEGK